MTLKLLLAEHERPREKLIEKGASALSDSELLAIILRTGRPNKSVLQLARELLENFGGFRGLLHASPNLVMQISGISVARYSELQAILEIARRYLYQTIQRKDILKCTEDTIVFLRSRLRDEPREIFAGIFLDHRNYIIAYEELMKGTLQTAQVYPREVIKRILHYNAASIILAHNHPSGYPEPSEADWKLTQKLQFMFEVMSTTLLDHIIIAENDYFSFKERGLI